MSKALRAIVVAALAIAIPVVWALVSITPFASGPVAYAQTTGIIAGTVEYHDGTLLSGADVTWTKASGGSDDVTTDASGAFSISSLAPGSDYSLSVTYGTTTSSLSSTDVSNVVVTAGQTITVAAISLGGNGWVACDSVVTTNCVQSLQTSGGTDITTARAEPKFYGSSIMMLPVYGVSGGLTYTSNVNNKHRELGDYGLSTSSTLVIKILLDAFEPKAVMAKGANLQGWDYNTTTKLFTITVKPTNVSYAFDRNDPTVTCNATTCVNQASFDYSAYAFMGVADMSDMPDMPAGMADFVSKVNGVYISTNGQYVTMPQPNSSAKFTFAVGAPHLKYDGTLNEGGFFKLWMPNDLLEYMWSKNPSQIYRFNSSVAGASSSLTFTQKTNNGRAGTLMEQTGISYSIHDVEIEPSSATPAASKIGLGILAGLLALLLIWTVQRRMRQANLLNR